MKVIRILIIALLTNTYSVNANQLGLGEDFQKVVRESYDTDGLSNKELRPITRAEIIKRAHEALNHKFKIRATNYSTESVVNQCQKENIWLRPYRLYNNMNKIVSGIPYRWGGYFRELSEFDTQLKQGRILGDVCTCRDPERNYCVESKSLGLDCSGFVSYAWKTEYYATSKINEITHPIEWSDLKPGDAINNPGHHIIIFQRYSRDKNYIHAIESTVRCDGVCETAFRKYDLEREGFRPIRYNLIQD